MIKKYFHYYITRIKRYFEKNSKSRFLVAALMTVAISVLAFGIFYLTKRGLESTQQGEDPFMVEAIPLYIYQLFFLVTGFLIFVSSSIFGLFNFFKGDRDDWIMAGPNFESLCWVNLFRAVIDSSWPVIVLAVPLLLAVQAVFSLPTIYFIFSLITIFIFSALMATTAVVIIFLLSVIFKIFNLKSFKALAGSIGVICLIVGAAVWSRIVNVDINHLFQVEEAIDPSLTYLQNNFLIFPSYLPAMTIFYGQLRNFGLGFFNGSLLVGFFLITLSLFYFFKNKFLYIWQLFQEGSFEAKTKLKNAKKTPLKIKAPKSKEGVIFKKEFLVNLRSPKNIFWFSFLMILMIAQVGVVNLLEKYVGIGMSSQAATSGLTPALQTGVILFFISALILRFVFPALSQEGDTAWILGSAPLDFKDIFKTKSNFYSLVMLLISFVALGVYVIPLGASVKVVSILTLIIVLGVFSLTMLGLSMGSIFVNFETDDPQKLSTSPAGIAFILSSMIYNLVGSYLVYTILSNQSYVLLIVFALVSAIIYFTSKYLAQKSLQNLEFL